MISFSEASEAEPRSQILSTLRDSLTLTISTTRCMLRRPVTHKNIVRLKICVEDVAFAQETQTQEHLLGVCSDCLKINTYISTKLFQDFAEVDANNDQHP